MGESREERAHVADGHVVDPRGHAGKGSRCSRRGETGGGPRRALEDTGTEDVRHQAALIVVVLQDGSEVQAYVVQDLAGGAPIHRAGDLVGTGG